MRFSAILALPGLSALAFPTALVDHVPTVQDLAARDITYTDFPSSVDCPAAPGKGDTPLAAQSFSRDYMEKSALAVLARVNSDDFSRKWPQRWYKGTGKRQDWPLNNATLGLGFPEVCLEKEHAVYKMPLKADNTVFNGEKIKSPWRLYITLQGNTIIYCGASVHASATENSAFARCPPAS